MNKEYFNGVGRRKNSTARVYLSDGKGKFSINNVSDDINTYLKRESLVIHAVKPLEILNLKDKISLTAVSSSYFGKEYFAPRPLSERLLTKKLDYRNANIMRPWEIALEEYITNNFQ